MKLHKFVNDYFYNGQVKYQAGLHYEPNDETRVAVAQGHAEEVDGKESMKAQPFVDPRTVETRKAQVRAQIQALEAELERLEKVPPAPAAATKASDDKAQAAQDRADARAEAKADRAAAER